MCVILHNLLIGFNNEQFEIDEEEIRAHSTDDENPDKFNFINPETNGVGGDRRKQLDLHLRLQALPFHSLEMFWDQVLLQILLEKERQIQSLQNLFYRLLIILNLK